METNESDVYWQCRALLQEFNFAPSTNIARKKAALEKLFGKIAGNVWIEAPFYCDFGKNISIGEHTFINFNCVFLDGESITIGKNVLIGPNVHLYASTHPTKASDRIQYTENGQVSIKTMAKPIMIGDNTWIGGNSVIMPGVTIGHNVTIGAGSVVNRDIPDDVLALGNPCVVKRNL